MQVRHLANNENTMYGCWNGIQVWIYDGREVEMERQAERGGKSER